MPIAWTLIEGATSEVGTLYTDREVRDSDIVVVNGRVYRVASVDNKDYELYVYSLDDDVSVHINGGAV